MAVLYKYTGKVHLLWFLTIKLFCHFGTFINLNLSSLFMQVIMACVCKWNEMLKALGFLTLWWKSSRNMLLKGKVDFFFFPSPKIAPWKLLHYLMTSCEISQGKVLRRGEENWVDGTVITVLCVSARAHKEIEMWQHRLLSLPGKWYEDITFQQRTLTARAFQITLQDRCNSGEGHS